MSCFSRKRKGKGKLSDLPEEAEEGELMAPIPFASPPKQFGKKSGANALIGVKNERVVENAEMRHSWFAWHITQIGDAGVLLICVSCYKIFKAYLGYSSSRSRQHGLEMATSSRGDKGKAPMVEQKDIGTEEGELLDVHPPLPEPTGRSGSNKKRKKHAREEEGPLAVALLSPAEEEKRAENARKKAEKDEHYRQNSVFRHRWFVWFTQETNNQIPMEQKFFTPGSLRGIQNFRSHLMELAIVKFLEKKEKPDARSWETFVSAMSQRLVRFLEEVPKNWDKLYDVWLKSREFESWTEDVVRQKGEKPLLIIPGLTMRNDEEKKKWKRTAEVWAQWFQPPKSIKDHSCTSAKYKACDSMSDNTIRFISKDSFTRRDETTRLGIGGLSKDKKMPMLLFPIWNGDTLEKYINLEKRSRGPISLEGVRLNNEESRARVTADEWLNIEIFRKHRLQIAGTMVAGLKFMHLHKWLHCDIHLQNILLHFPSWDWNETKSRADSGRDNENRPLSSLIRCSMVFVGIGDLGWVQSFEEVQKDFEPYPVSDENPRKWIAPELNPKLAIADEDENKFMTKFSQESDIYALGWLIREMCGDFFTDMTDEEKREYNQAVYTRGLHIPNAAEVHGWLLREGLEKMTWKKICHPFRNQRRTMDFWAHYFNEQLFIDPVTCARPFEYGPRAKVHPDGPHVSRA
ncbi:hypothetical protein R1sor_012667 [Riccia sorocarpa]|uniref:Serine-threonine/tyrosine-protein kinase catalytic domain-containing protein n=1 Tax=Riccia sorocarpa TaxID=122646 RepID=A0ABD3I8H9_9MARC